MTATTEIWFYHLQREPLARVLPALAEKSLVRGWRAVIQATTEERVGALDELLWTYSDDSFLAHGTAREGDAHLQPVYLTTTTDNPNGAAIRLCVEGADAAEALAAVEHPYERLIVLFDGTDAEQLESARAQWQLLKTRGHELAYWQQTAAGAWERKA
ncbi:MAG TPA: DNA polymerase III subunit chi [Beijerinckiaceae bacterium]|nr:DNA polymerase III subunit chi [Beijerinckiaceae bacterium]